MLQTKRLQIVFIIIVSTIIIFVITKKILLVNATTTISLDFTQSNSAKDSTNTTGFWNTNSLGGAHAQKQWTTLGGSTSITVATTTNYFAGKSYPGQFDLTSNDNVNFFYVNTPDSSTWNISGMQWSASQLKWQGFSDTSVGSEVLMSSTTALTNLHVRNNNSGNPALVYDNSGGALRDLFYTIWNPTTSHWEDITGATGATIPFYGTADTTKRYSYSLNFDSGNLPNFTFNEHPSKQASLAARWNGSLLRGYESATVPDDLSTLFTSTVTDNVNTIGIMDSNKLPYVVWAYNTSGSLYDWYISYFDGTQWTKPSDGTAGADRIMIGANTFPSNGGLVLRFKNNKLYLLSTLKFSGDTYNSLLLSVFNPSTRAWSALDGTAAVTSTANTVKTASTSNMIAVSLDVDSAGNVYTTYTESPGSGFRPYVKQWDASALVWRDVTTETDASSDDLYTATSLSAPNVSSQTNEVMVDSNNRPIVLLRAKDQTNTSTDSYYFLRSTYVTSTPSIIQTNNVAPQNSRDDFLTATIEYTGDLNNGTIKFQLSGDDGKSWVDQQVDGTYIFDAPTRSVLVRATLTPAANGFTTPVLKTASLTLKPRLFRSLIATTKIPEPPTISTTNILLNEKKCEYQAVVRYNFSSPSNDVGGFRLVEIQTGRFGEQILKEINSTGQAESADTTYLDEKISGTGPFCNRAVVAINSAGESAVSKKYPCVSLDKKPNTTTGPEVDVPAETKSPSSATSTPTLPEEITTSTPIITPIQVITEPILANGTFFRPTSGTFKNFYFVVDDGKSHLMASGVRNALGYNTRSALLLPPSIFNDFPIGLDWNNKEHHPKGTILRYYGSSTLYRTTGNNTVSIVAKTPDKKSGELVESATILKNKFPYLIE